MKKNSKQYESVCDAALIYADDYFFSFFLYKTIHTQYFRLERNIS